MPTGGMYSGGALTGGRGTIGNKIAAETNPWIQHVRRMAPELGLSYAAAVADPRVRSSYTPTAGYAQRKAKAAKYGKKKNVRPYGFVRAPRGGLNQAQLAAQQQIYLAKKAALARRASEGKR